MPPQAKVATIDLGVHMELKLRHVSPSKAENSQAATLQKLPPPTSSDFAITPLDGSPCRPGELSKEDGINKVK